MHMVSIRVLKNTSLVIQVIEETIAELDPYNQDFITEEPNYSIQHCEFPEQVDDPLALVRLLRGDEFAERLEYEDHLELILYNLTTCMSEELSRRGIAEADLDDDSESDAPVRHGIEA